MACFRLDDRVRLAIELALTADSRDPSQLELQEAAARKLGMTGAEIDAARRGTSFDLLVALAVALAMAARADDAERLHSARIRAVKAGIPDAVCAEIETLSKNIGRPLPPDINTRA